MSRTILLTLVALFLFPGCDGESRWGADWPSEAERTIRPKHAPTPFTAAQICAGCPDGRRSTWRNEGPDGKPYLHTFTFSEGTEKDVRLTSEVTSLDGKPLRPAGGNRSPWTSLQSHASFPEATTTIDRETLRLPAGWFHCMRYTREGDTEGTYQRYWFAHELPGPPVLMEQYKEGALAFRMVLVKHEAP